MWVKLILLSLYLVVVFIVSRLLEAVTFRRLLPPTTSTTGSLEPSSSMTSELDSDESGTTEVQHTEEAANTGDTHFTCGPHFYEQVEDSKDSAWLVRVVAAKKLRVDALLPESHWHTLVQHLAQFGIRAGTLNCTLDTSLCFKKGWTNSQLVLALPRGERAKEDVLFYNVPPSARDSKAVLKWISSKMASRVEKVNAPSVWLAKNASPEVRVLLFTTLLEAPLLLSALAVRFTGRVKFGMTSVDSTSINSRKPLLVISTPEGHHEYGRGKGEMFSYHSMERYLRSLSPEMNDALLLSIFLTNLLVGLNIFLLPSSSNLVWRHMINCFLLAIKYNSFLFLTWLCITTLYKFSFMNVLTTILAQGIRIIAQTHIASYLRYDWALFYSLPFMIFTYFGFGLALSYFWLKWEGVQESLSEEENDRPWWVTDSFIFNYLFRPMAVSLSRPSVPPDLEVGMELLIERLAVPHFWLEPIIPMDYIKDLPVWSHVASESHSSSSEEEDGEEGAASTINNATSKSLPASKDQNICAASMPSCIDTSSHSKLCDSVKQQPISTKRRRSCQKPERVASSPPANMRLCHECHICLEDYRHGQEICGLPCGHNYHCNCIMMWLLRDNHCCPICRRPTYPCC